MSSCSIERAVALALLIACLLAGTSSGVPEGVARAEPAQSLVAQPDEVLGTTQRQVDRHLARALAPTATVAPTLVPVPSVAPTLVPVPSVAPTLVPVPTVAPTPAPTLVHPSPQSAVTPEAAPPAALTREQRALARVGFDPAAIGYTLSFHPHTGAYRGLTLTVERRIQIFVKPGDSVADIAYAIGHEMGHAVDHILNSQQDRAAWMQARGISADTPWWPSHLRGDFATPAGDFAECFAQWRVGSASHSSWGQCGPALGLMAQLAAG